MKRNCGCHYSTAEEYMHHADQIQLKMFPGNIFGVEVRIIGLDEESHEVRSVRTFSST